VKLNTMGALLSDLKLEFLGLWIQAGVYFVLAYLVYRWQIKCSWNKK
jgi:ABC-2 type transport system permease protein